MRLGQIRSAPVELYGILADKAVAFLPLEHGVRN